MSVLLGGGLAWHLGCVVVVAAALAAAVDPVRRDGRGWAAVAAGLLLAATADDLGLVWLGAAVASLGARATDRRGISVSAAALLLMLLGSVLLQWAARPAIGGGTGSVSWATLAAAAHATGPPAFLGGGVLLVGAVGFAVLAPFARGELVRAAAPAMALATVLRTERLMAEIPGAAHPALVVGAGLLAMGAGNLALWRRERAGGTLLGVGLTLVAIGQAQDDAAVLLLSLLPLASLAVAAAAGRWRPIAWAALLGVPPSGLFAGQFAVLTSGTAASFAAAALLLAGVVAAARRRPDAPPVTSPVAWLALAGLAAAGLAPGEVWLPR